ncbi:hypothetical protein D3C85_109620 [compost metagenome]
MFEQGRLDVEVDQGVAAQHDGGFIEKVTELLDLLHAAGRSQRLGHDFARVIRVTFEGIADLHAELVPLAEILLDFFMQITDINHDFGNAVTGQVLDQVSHHRLAQDRYHRFR